MRNTILFLGILNLYGTLYASTEYCDSYVHKQPKKFIEMKDNFQKKIKQLSDHKLIASEADAILSKLIQAKSPMITKWINKRNLDPATQDTEIVLKWRQYYFENFILGRYPNKSQKINILIENLFSEMNNRAFTKKNKTRFESLFKEALSLAVSRIENSKLSAKVKKSIIIRFKNIKLYWFKSLKGTKFERMPLEFVKWGIAYDPVPNEINIGIEALAYNNYETIFSVFAHEIGHSIDPCRWGAFIQGENPFNSVISCLRGEKSANARKRDDSLMGQLVKNKKLHKELAKSLKMNPTCNKTHYPPTGIQKDQMPETFADWFSAEVVSLSKRYINKNLRRDLCKERDLISGSSYVSNQKRLKAIYFANPTIKKALKVNSSYKYCSF